LLLLLLLIPSVFFVFLFFYFVFFLFNKQNSVIRNAKQATRWPRNSTIEPPTSPTATLPPSAPATAPVTKRS
jgi:hypothetical protein